LRQLLARLLEAAFRHLPFWERAASMTAGWRRVVADSLATYQDLERAFLRPGRPPGAGRGRFHADEWSLVPGGCFVRLMPHSYQTTRAEVYVPARVAFTIERDGLGRVTGLSVHGGLSAVLEYDDRPSADRLDLGDGGSLPVWRFRRVSLRATDADGGDDTTAEALDSGWVARDLRQLAALDPHRYPQIAQRIQAARALVRDASQLAPLTRQTTWASPAAGGTDPLQDITDLGHYENGLKAVLEDLQRFPSHRKKLEWLQEHFRRLRRAYEYAASLLASLMGVRPQGGASAGGGQGLRPPAEGWLGGWLDPGEHVGLPDDSRKQALGWF
jgi:hypothetical protein